MSNIKLVSYYRMSKLLKLHLQYMDYCVGQWWCVSRMSLSTMEVSFFARVTQLSYSPPILLSYSLPFSHPFRFDSPPLFIWNNSLFLFFVSHIYLSSSWQCLPPHFSSDPSITNIILVESPFSPYSPFISIPFRSHFACCSSYESYNRHLPVNHRATPSSSS